MVTPGLATSWSWAFGDGGTSSLQSPPNHTYTYTKPLQHNGHGTGAQTWPVSLTVMTSPGCTGVGTATVTLDP